MDLRQIEQKYLGQSSNVLVLSPLTPTGAKAYMELLSASCSADTKLAVVTYTQPPDMWVSDWKKVADFLPSAITFIHGGPAMGAEVLSEGETTVRTIQVSPRDPMDIITALGETMQQWRDNGDQIVVSVQTLTVLLEYIDFATTFRYLHVLIHRVQGTGATGYYQMDPGIHDEETVNTLSVLFDIILVAGTDGSGDIEWSVVDAIQKNNADRKIPSIPAVPTHPEVTDTGVFSTVWNALLALLGRRETDGSVNQHQRLPTSEQGQHHRETRSSTDVEGHAGREVLSGSNDTALLTDEERIQQLLRESGGRMNQSDIVEITTWSGSSVSRKLSKMEDEGLITRVRVGRGNIVFLGGYEPDATRSAFDRYSRDQ